MICPRKIKSFNFKHIFYDFGKDNQQKISQSIATPINDPIFYSFYDNNPIGTIFHEMGHSVYYLLYNWNNKKQFFNLLNKDMKITSYHKQLSAVNLLAKANRKSNDCTWGNVKHFGGIYTEDQLITSDPKQLLEIEKAKKQFADQMGQ